MKVSELITIEVNATCDCDSMLDYGGTASLELTAKVRAYPELTKTKKIPTGSTVDAINDAAASLRASIAKSVFEIQKLTA